MRTPALVIFAIIVAGALYLFIGGTNSAKHPIKDINEFLAVTEQGKEIDSLVFNCKTLKKDFENSVIIPSRDDDEVGQFEFLENDEVVYDAMLFVETPSDAEWEQIKLELNNKIMAAYAATSFDNEELLIYRVLMIIAPKLYLWVGEKEYEVDLSQYNKC